MESKPGEVRSRGVQEAILRCHTSFIGIRMPAARIRAHGPLGTRCPANPGLDAAPHMTSEKLTRTKAAPGATPRAPGGSSLARALEALREAGGLGGAATPRPPAPHPLLRVGTGTGRSLAPLLSGRDAGAPGVVARPSEGAPERPLDAALPDPAAVDPSTIVQPARRPVEKSAPKRSRAEQASEDRTRGPQPDALDSTLTATIRRWAKPTTPKELEARGVKRVRSVSMSRIASLIEKAINRELIARTLDGDTDDALSLSANARAGFLELARHEMSGRVDAEAESSAFADLGRLRAELDARRSELEEKERRLESLDPGPEDDSLERRLRAVFASRAADRDPALEAEVVRVALEELAEMRCRAQEKRRAESRRETHQLERRIAKLAGLLEQTEGELRRTKAEGAIDPGLASVFAEVQGLDHGDERFAQKQDLMKCIFEANLELQS